MADLPLVAVVGVCASGKSTLAVGLKEQGIRAVTIAQEHSHVPYLWSLKRPDLLVMLDCTWETARARRPQISYGPDRMEEQRRRLRHARLHCHLFLPTDSLTIAEVRERVLAAYRAAFLRDAG